MRLYTRTGDSGETSLWGGRRVLKESARVEAMGLVDLTSSHVGMASALGVPDHVETMLDRVQDGLYVTGCDLMAPDATGSGASVPRISADRTSELESWIDELTATAPMLRTFVHPGGSPGAAALHVARATCRSAERQTWRVAREEPVSPTLLAFLNRLADFLFAAARTTNDEAGVDDQVSRAD